jgi:hypothetical protein
MALVPVVHPIPEYYSCHLYEVQYYAKNEHDVPVHQRAFARRIWYLGCSWYSDPDRVKVPEIRTRKISRSRHSFLGRLPPPPIY